MSFLLDVKDGFSVSLFFGKFFY